MINAEIGWFFAVVFFVTSCIAVSGWHRANKGWDKTLKLNNDLVALIKMLRKGEQ